MIKIQKDHTTSNARLTVSLDEIYKVAYGESIEFDKDIYDRLDQRREQVVQFINESKAPAYGFNRGFGHNVDEPVDEKYLALLQENLIRSHSCAVGEPAPIEIVRAAMFLRAISLAQGYSGVRSAVVKMLVEMLNNKITPVVPRLGSVGASGDLAPMSHIALAMFGEGLVYINNKYKKINSLEALNKTGLEPLRLEMKEGLALNNGIQYSTSIGILSYFKLKDLVQSAAIITAISTQVMLGSDTPFRADLHELRPHYGAQKVASWIWNLLQDSPIRHVHASYDIDGEIQDPYNIRCAAQILGACYDLIEEVKNTLEIEANSVTDNPLILPDEKGKFTQIISGGHFHGMPVAVKLYNFIQAMAIISRLSNMRCARYIDEKRNKGLGSDLKWPGLLKEIEATCSGMMIPEYTSASLTNYIWGACMPTHLFSLSTDAGQEDHVSMSAGLAVRVWETIPRLAETLAIELAMASQAANIRKENDTIPSKISLNNSQKEEIKKAQDIYMASLRNSFDTDKFNIIVEHKLKYKIKKEDRDLSMPCEKILSKVQEMFPVLKEDRVMADEISNLAEFILYGELNKIITL